MKKYCLFLFMLLFAFSSHAQSKITKLAILGKWAVSSVELKGIVYYSVEKDSIALADSISREAAEKGVDLETMKPMAKLQFAGIASMRIIFNADGTTETSLSEEAPGIGATYTIDEEKSMLIISNKDGSTKTTKAEMLADGALKMQIPDMASEGWIVLKKSK
jgi:hypothetical protein